MNNHKLHAKLCGLVSAQGLGDLGLNGLGISVGKLDLYVAAAGFNPARVLPIVLDVGTNNERLRDSPLYLGLKHPRIEGDAYYEVGKAGMLVRECRVSA